MKVILIAAVTLDGKIAKGHHEPVDWTGKVDKKFFAEETKKAGVVIMGHNTFLSIGRPLKDRLNIVLTKNPVKQKNIKNILFFTNQKLTEILQDLEKKYQKVFVIGGAEINTLFLNSGRIDEIWLTIIPKVFGEGINLFNKISNQHNFLLSKVVKNKDGSVILRYKLER